MTACAQKIKDQRLERRIQRLAGEGISAYLNGQIDIARSKLSKMTEAVYKRSPQQIARMEKAMGLSHG
jgi:hypothetical protein